MAWQLQPPRRPGWNNALRNYTDRERTDGASVAEPLGALILELANEHARGAVLVQLDRLWAERHAFGRADAGVRIDDHVYEQDGVLLWRGG